MFRIFILAILKIHSLQTGGRPRGGFKRFINAKIISDKKLHTPTKKSKRIDKNVIKKFPLC